MGGEDFLGLTPFFRLFLVGGFFTGFFRPRRPGKEYIIIFLDDEFPQGGLPGRALPFRLLFFMRAVGGKEQAVVARGEGGIV